MDGYAKMERLLQRGRRFLGVRYPIVCGAMTWVSEPKLVAAVGQAGGFGCLAGGGAPAEVLESQIAELRAASKQPFGVNLITMSPRYAEQMAMLQRLEQPVPFVIFAGGLPKEREIAAVKERGSQVLGFAATPALAERLLRNGADALIIEGSEAGGHVGQVSTTVLVQQMLPRLAERVPVFVAGGIGSGTLLAHLLLLGAAGVQLGTRFVLTAECQAHPKFKECLLHADARNALATPQFDPRIPVSAVRTICNGGTQEFSRLQLRLLQEVEVGSRSGSDAQRLLEEFWLGALRRAAVEGEVETGSVMAGQSVGLVQQETTVAALLQELLKDAEAELTRIKRLLA